MKPLTWHQKRLAADMDHITELVLDVARPRDLWTVMELLHLCRNLKIGSIASMHARLKWLEENGYVQFLGTPMDKRLKQVRLLPKAHEYLGKA
jgi:hypothetical protein